MKKRKKVLVIVAHPDDETIWMGGTILKNRDWDWTIFSLCRKNDADRAPRFRKVCKYYGAECIIGDLDDEVLQPLAIEEVINKIKEFLPDKKYDYIFTHGENGEYGHLRHKEIHKAVKNMAENGEIKCKKIYYFAYVDGERGAPHDSKIKIPVPSNGAAEILRLDNSTYKDKYKLITQLYGFEKNIFETLSCHEFESFNVK